MYFDSIEYYNYTESNDTVYAEDFASPSSDGMFGGFKKTDVKGNPSFGTAGEAIISGGSGDSAAIEKKFEKSIDSLHKNANAFSHSTILDLDPALTCKIRIGFVKGNIMANPQNPAGLPAEREGIYGSEASTAAHVPFFHRISRFFYVG